MYISKNSEIPTSCNTDDYISENNYAFFKRVLEHGPAGLDAFLFPPIMNFHTSYYRSIDKRWG